jgi:N-acetylglucosamine-6-sulfatase
MHRALVLAIALSLAALSSTPAAAQTETASPAGRPDEATVPAGVAPDVIVVMVDDFGYLPDERVLERLPNTRQLWLDGGLHFEQMYDQTPLCGPSRVSMLTGKNTLHHGVVKNDPRPFDDTETVSVALQQAGYHTFIAGKYLNRYDGSVIPPGWDKAFMLKSETRPSFWLDGRSVAYPGRFSDDVIRQQAVRWLRRAPADQPLLAWVSAKAPHVCESDGPQCYEPEVMPRDQGAQACSALAPSKPPSYSIRTNPLEIRSMPPWPAGWRLRRVCESLLVVDRMVGQLVAAQAERERPAWFIFLSDNGMSWGQKGFSLKHTPPSSRAPFYMAGPGLATGRTAALTSKIDVAPTIAELAGMELPWADGSSFLPLLFGEAFSGRSELLEVMPRSNDRSYAGWESLRTPEHRFIRWDTGQRELYDLAADPWERRDLVAAEPELASTMEARLDELLEASAPDAAS